MTPLKQRFRHDPEAGVYGDCHRAAIASVLDLPLDDVPHFMDGAPGPEESNRRIREFLTTRGLFEINIPFHGGDDPEATLRVILGNMHVVNEGTYYLLGGTSKNGCGHTVVCLNSEIVHDPAIDASGIVGPMEDGCYWLTFFGSLSVARGT